MPTVEVMWRSIFYVWVRGLTALVIVLLLHGSCCAMTAYDEFKYLICVVWSEKEHSQLR